jgi:Pro-kumamolisin, activation domain/Bacterial Ig-like domain (group 3)
MQNRHPFLRGCLAAAAFLFLSFAISAQTGNVQPRITAAVSESQLTTLSGNTHPYARRQFDRGAAPDSLPMQRMLLVLKRNPAQEATLDTLMEQQQDPSSSNYHAWLTPQQFGQQFGPADADIQTITLWLESHGFTVNRVSNGRTVIEFSGTAGQVRDAFHTEIHQYNVSGENHWANSSDPQIPTALTPVVAGIDSLYNFPRQAMHYVGGELVLSKKTRKFETASPSLMTFGGLQCGVQKACYGMSPYDFAKIYNVAPLWSTSPTPIDGTGVTIAVVGESDVSVQDIRNFRSIFSLPASDPQVIVDGADPGMVQGDETESDLDLEWTGGVAKGATIDFVISQTTEASLGVDLSAQYIVDNNLAPILSESYGICELFLGSAGNQFYNQLWQQAAAQGITALVATGDSGSAVCDRNAGTNGPAEFGLSVSGFSSTPYNIAVGGTDFNDLTNASTYWSATNSVPPGAPAGTPATVSALSYIPETTWNNTCTNAVFGNLLGYSPSAETNCNNQQLESNGFDVPVGGSGGKSNCINGSGQTTSSCTQGHAKPAWQTALTPADGARDVPDVSMMAAVASPSGAFYLVCAADITSGAYTSCQSSDPNTRYIAIGGTSASTPVFAGIMALVDQETGSRQGNANYILYKLAGQSGARCNSSSGAGTNCVFYDTTNGTIAMPCAKGSPNCNVSNPNDSVGVLSGYPTASDYDLATGLGSVNANNLVGAWTKAQTALETSTTTLTLTPPNGVTLNTLVHGQSVGVNIGVTGTPGMPTGNVSLIANEGPNGATGATDGVQGFVLNSSGSATGSTSDLPGGSYAVVAQYAGDATFGASKSSSTSVTVAPESSKTLISIPIFDPSSGRETGNQPTSVAYGSLHLGRIDVGSSQASLSYPPVPVCNSPSCPTGKITWTDSANGGPPTPLDGGAFSLNSSGYAEDSAIQQLTGGTHQLSASYSGDNSYNPSSTTYTLSVTPAATQLTVPYIPYSPEIVGTPVSLTTQVISNLYTGVAPTGTITFYDGGAAIPATVTYSGHAGTTGLAAGLSGTITATFTTSGTHSITASYGGDTNYKAETSNPWNATVLYPTTMSQAESSTNINYGQSVTVTAKATSTGKSPAMTGTFQFNGTATVIPGPVTPTLSTDASGNQVLTASVTTTPQSQEVIQVLYSGDSNYQEASSSAFVNVNIPDFSLTSGAPSLSISAGQTGTAMITVTPQSSMASSVALTCNLMDVAGVTSSFNPPSPLSLANGTAVSTTLTLTTLPASSNPTTQVIRRAGAGIVPTFRTGAWTLSMVTGLAAIFSLLSPRKRYRVAFGLSLICALSFALGCGGGTSGDGGGGGGGGGGAGPAVISVTLSTSGVKAPYGTTVTFTATINSTKTPTGTVQFFDAGSGIAAASVTNGVAKTQFSNLLVGTHVISAKYTGDANNQASQTNGAINQVITGTATVFVGGATSTLNHTIPINVMIQ